MKTINYTNINEILSRLLRHPLLEGITKEECVSYLADFINICGYYPMYQHREGCLKVENWRALVPCDVVSIDMVEDLKTGLCMRAMTESFHPKEERNRCGELILYTDSTWKLQGNIIYTSFKEGDIKVSYTTIPLDEDGFPLLIDDPIFLRAFELYIKKIIFTSLFDMSKINGNVLQHTEQEYAWAIGALKSNMNIPDTSEMESIKNMWDSLIQKNNYFTQGFRGLGGVQDNLKVH